MYSLDLELSFSLQNWIRKELEGLKLAKKQMAAVTVTMRKTETFLPTVGMLNHLIGQ